jgi:hypothetical protein
MRVVVRVFGVAMVTSLILSAGTGCGAPDGRPVGSAPVTSSPSLSSTSALGACRTEDLSVRLGVPDSAKFEEGTTIELANTARPCVLSGYVEARLLDASGAPMPTTVRPLDRSPAQTFVMPAGGRAYASLVWNRYEGAGTLCPPYPISIAVSLPGQAATTVAPWISGDEGSVCQGVLKVSPLRATRAPGGSDPHAGPGGSTQA